MRSGDRIAAAERVRDKKRGYDCFISLALVEDHYFIGAPVRISLIP